MRLISPLFLTIAAVVLAAAVPADPVSAQVQLRYHFEPGQKIDYLMTQNMTMVMAFQGQNITTTMQQDLEMTWQIASVDKDGNAKVKQKFNNLLFIMEAPTGKIVFDSKAGKEPDGPVGKILAPIFKAMVGAEFIVHMDPQGNISKVEIPEAFLKEMKNFPGGGGFGGMFSQESFKEMMTKSGLNLPKAAVNIGDTWNKKVEVNSPIGKMTINTVCTYKGKEERRDQSLEWIDVEPKITLKPDPNSAVKAKIKSQSIKGKSYFDSKNGQLAEVQMTQTLEMELDAGGMVINQNMKQEVTLKRQ
jgi:hypothetical protein